MSYSQNWNLDKIFKGGIDSPELTAKLDLLNKQINQLKTTVVNLNVESTNEEIISFIDSLQVFTAGMQQTYSFVGSWSAVNYGDARANVKYDALSKISIEDSKVYQTFSKLLASLPDEKFEKLISEPNLQDVAFALKEFRDHAKRLLDDSTEEIISRLRNEGLKAWSSHYDTIASGLSTSYTTKNGEVKNISAGQALNMYSSLKDNSERADLMKNYEQMWGEAENLSADTINHIAGSRMVEQKVHGYKDHLEEPLEYNRMKKETLDAMWGAVSDNKQMMIDYLNRKAKLLGVDKIQWQDQTAPISIEGYEERELSYDDAANFIVDNFRKYSPKMAELAQTAFDNGWIESEDRTGKQPGGFDTGLPELKEDRIFLTFTGSVSDAATIAHELGHAFHSHVLYDLPVWRENYAMNVAETASTFAETIVNNANVASAKSDAEKIVLLDAKLENAVAMFLNIHARFLFEDAFYKARKDALQTPEQLNQLMINAQKEAFAGLLDDKGVHPHFWTSKLHFFFDDVPFYNFPYTFGFLFSTGIFAWASKQENFEDAYIDLLRDTANMTTEDLAKKHLGVDLTKKDFWNDSIALVKKDIDEFIKLTDSYVE
ncbi:MAG: M3 family oligoendopeptidase [Lactobacillaceae bacterium]|jgi:pepF/M3 family oligoendopeptidase|nr:M3 family oligoendopeptidase [Lactobacillaceae bacterium]